MKDQPIALLIETATEICSVALSRGDKILGVRESNDGNPHAKYLIPFIDDLLRCCRMSLQDLTGIVVSAGPGSYTGLRIGASSAKGMAYALSIPVITVLTLETLSVGARAWWRQNGQKGSPQIIPMIDARRMEVFTTRYDFDLNRLDSISATVVEKETYSSCCTGQPVIFCGNGMPKCKELLSQYPNVFFCDRPVSAQYMLPVALQKWQVQDFADVAYFEPFYLKEYIAGRPFVKGLR